MLDTTELVHSLTSPPALSHDTPIVSDNLPVTNPQFFQDSGDLMDGGDDEWDETLQDWKDIPWEDDTVD